ncbi:MAG: hypothetical protein IIU68_00390, partial [Bacteroidales bacterium]|nr:hypothetical protein [Bacteroidales bacterium]
MVNSNVSGVFGAFSGSVVHTHTFSEGAFQVFSNSPPSVEFNHYAYGAIGEWMFTHCLGIQRDVEKPAYKHILLQPKVGGEMSNASGYFESPYGVISSSWEKTATGFIYTVTVPANTTASLTLQASGIDKVKVLKGAEGVGPFRSLTGKVMSELKSGTYTFEVNN